MNVFLILAFTLLLLESVDLKKKKRKHKNKENVTKSDDEDDILRYNKPYATERHPEPYPTEKDDGWKDHWDGAWEKPEDKTESGQRMKLLDLHGTMREKFIYAVTTTDERVSVVCSPYSAILPLGILLLGAGEKATEKELVKSLGLRKKSDTHDYFKDLSRKIKHLSEVKTQLANRVYFHEDNKLKSSFKEDAESTFGACVENIDMRDAVNTAKEVNKWVKYHTSEKITQIIQPSDISPHAVVIVVNAFYFEGHWEHRFDRSYSEPFYGASGRHTIQLMKTEHRFTYGSSKVLQAEAILIPYRGGEANMLVLLPYRRDGLTSLLNQLKRDPDQINRIKMEKIEVELHLPKFKIETSMDLKVLYEKVGLKEIFTDGTGLDKIVKGMTVKIDKAVHKAMINVNEWGTIAAAVSINQGVGAAAPMKHVVFRADHPFLFFIIAHKQQLFGGTFVG